MTESSPLTPRAARTVTRIVDAAARLFGDRGYQQASMNAVARAAGVSKGLLHYHFRSKQDLLLAAQRSTFAQIRRNFERRFEAGEVGLDTALDGLDALYQAVRDLRGWAPFMVETLSLAADEGPVARTLDAFYAEWEPVLLHGIERAFAAERERLLLPPDRLAELVRLALHGIVVELARARDQAALERVDRSYRDLRAIFERTVLSGPLPMAPGGTP